MDDIKRIEEAIDEMASKIDERFLEFDSVLVDISADITFFRRWAQSIREQKEVRLKNLKLSVLH